MLFRSKQTTRRYLRYNLKTDTAYYIDEKIKNIMGKDHQEEYSKNYLYKIIKEESISVYEEFLKKMHDGVAYAKTQIQILLPGNINKWLDCRYSLIFDQDNKPYYSIISYYDITERKEKELAYQKIKMVHNSKVNASDILYELNITKNKFSSIIGYDGNRIKSPMDEARIASAYQMICEHYAVLHEDRLGVIGSLNQNPKLFRWFEWNL